MLLSVHILCSLKCNAYALIGTKNEIVVFVDKKSAQILKSA